MPISRWLALRRWHFLIHKEVSRRSRAKRAGASVTRGLALIVRGPQCKLCFVAKSWYSWQKKMKVIGVDSDTGATHTTTEVMK